MRRSIERLGWAAAAAASVIVVVGLVTASRPPADRVEAVASRLRCPVCQTVSVAESPSETARAMQDIIVEQVADGRSDDQIIAFFVERYGPWVILDPPTSGPTLALWILPGLVLAAGLVGAFRRKRRLPSAAKAKGHHDPAT